MSALKAIVFDYYGTLNHPTPPGLVAALTELAKHYQLSINSSSGVESIGDFLREQTIEQLFSHVAGYRLGRDKGDKLREYLEQTGFAPSECLFITDSADDVAEARAVGVAAVGVGWGNEPGDRLLAAGAEAVVQNLAELVSWLANRQR